MLPGQIDAVFDEEATDFNVSVNVINKDILLEKESKENLVDIDKNILEQNLTAEKIDSDPPTPFYFKRAKKRKNEI